MQEALAAAQDEASKDGRQELNNEGLLLALLNQPEGMVPPLLEKLGVSVPSVRESLESGLARQPRVQGSIQLYIVNELRATFEAAEREMTRMKDEFLSAEHFLLAVVD